MIACKGMAADFLSWYEQTSYQNSVDVIWNRGLNKAAQQSQPIDIFFTYRQTVCRILDLFSPLLAQTMSQIASESYMSFYPQLNFLSATPLSYESFYADLYIDEEFG